MRVINTEKVPIKIWLDYLEDDAERQAKNLANLPFVYKWVAIMPDSHAGYGMPIGGVMATDGVIIPNAVGVDIGCGMCAVQTSLDFEELDVEILKKIMGEIRQAIPVGFNSHDDSQENYVNSSLTNQVERRNTNYAKTLKIVHDNRQRAMCQLGTLGGGNHFIEIQRDNNGKIWIMLHSGSRYLGKTVASHYNRLAKELNKKWNSEVPPSFDLAFLPIDSSEGQEYIKEMDFCVQYAFENRNLMMKRIEEIIGSRTQAEFSPMINIAHNYAALENHYGKNVYVHRKGATRAREGEVGIIPGSQGTKSYIVEGKGNPESFMSCSHGAGRVMSRSKAKEKLNLEEEIRKMNEKGIIHGMRHQKDLDEAASAYKDIDVVMHNQKDLVNIIVELQPLAVIKG